MDTCHQAERDPSTNADIDELVELASSVLPAFAFVEGLDEAQSDALMTLHNCIAQRYGARAASRACASLGGVPALQQLLRALHRQKIKAGPHTRLMGEIDALLAEDDEVDRIRGAS